MAFHHHLNMQGPGDGWRSTNIRIFVPGKSSLKISVEFNFLPWRFYVVSPQKYQNQPTLFCPDTNDFQSLTEYEGTGDGWRSTNIRNVVPGRPSLKISARKHFLASHIFLAVFPKSTTINTPYTAQRRMAFHHYLNMQGQKMDGVPRICGIFVLGDHL